MGTRLATSTSVASHAFDLWDAGDWPACQPPACRQPGVCRSESGSWFPKPMAWGCVFTFDSPIGSWEVGGGGNDQKGLVEGSPIVSPTCVFLSESASLSYGLRTLLCLSRLYYRVSGQSRPLFPERHVKEESADLIPPVQLCPWVLVATSSFGADNLGPPCAFPAPASAPVAPPKTYLPRTAVLRPRRLTRTHF
jgi:hypothetical protein